MNITLPHGYHLKKGRCESCRRPLYEIDQIEGLPIYSCWARCGQDTTKDPRLPQRSLASGSNTFEYTVERCPEGYRKLRRLEDPGLENRFNLLPSLPAGSTVLIREVDDGRPTGRWFVCRMTESGWVPICEATVPDHGFLPSP